MRTVPGESSVSSAANKISVLILIAGLVFFISWLANYSWTIITTPYPQEYREGAILLLTDFFIHGINPFALANHPLMTNNYGFLYNLVVLPFAILVGNTLAIHRIVSILFILASCALIIWMLIKIGVTLPFALAGGGIVLPSLLFSVTPLARPDALGEFFFLLTVLLPWHRKFDTQSLIISGLTGILAFLSKPYFVLSVGLVATYVFTFVSKRKGLFYALSTIGTLSLVLYMINLYYECYFLDVILNNMGNSTPSNSHMLRQLILFIKAFWPCSLILVLVARDSIPRPSSRLAGLFSKKLLDFTHFDSPLVGFSINYFWFFSGCTFLVVTLVLGKHIGAYMSYFFQLITPGLILAIFQHKDVLSRNAALAVLLILINFSLLCFSVLYPNKLSMTQKNDWERLYRYIANSAEILNSPVLVPEMVRLSMLPVDSGQTEYYFNTKSYSFHSFAPDYKKMRQQGRKYLESIRNRVRDSDYDYIIVTLSSDPNYDAIFVLPKQSLALFASRPLIDRFYDRVELINVAMPQTGEYWIVEVNQPKKK